MIVATAVSYGCAVVGYLAFAVRVAIGSGANVRARLLLVALLSTATWAGVCLVLVTSSYPGLGLLAAVTEIVRDGAWYAFVWHLLQGSRENATSAPAATRLMFGVGIALLALTLIGETPFMANVLGLDFGRTAYGLRLGVAVFGLVLVEQLFRRIETHRRWAVKPLAIGLAGIFGFDLYFYADAMLFRQLDPDIWIARGMSNAIVIPFLAIATARNTGWTIDLHVSRQAVYRSWALLVSGSFLLAVAGAGYLLRFFGGDWARALQIEILFAGVVIVLLTTTSGRFRSKLKVFVSKHFFSYRYDYREEWLRFTAALSMDDSVRRVHERTIMALADLVESPAGVLLLRDDSDRFIVAAHSNMQVIDAVESGDGELVRFLEQTGWIIDLAALRADPTPYSGLRPPAWLDLIPSPWLIVPLRSASALLGFVVLSTPRTPIDVGWEVRDLLKTASRQAASYLGQIRATEALLEARKFDSFNRMSAFVVHDLKNLIAQLSLMLKNATRHRDNPAFQADMLATVENVVSRMNGLMLQLRTGESPIEQARNIDVRSVVQRACAAKADKRIRFDASGTPQLSALGHEDRLERVIGHLLQNSLDASPENSPVNVDVAREKDFALVSITDAGEGMSAEFVRERLFKPFQTTKRTGMGIGVYESAQYVASLGGNMHVDSAPAQGTVVRVRIPLADATMVAPMKEHAA